MAGPKRKELLKEGRDNRRVHRRKVYLGELTGVDLVFSQAELHAEVVDLSSAGVGVVSEMVEGSFRPVRGDRVHVSYGTRGGRRFRCWGVVATTEELTIRGRRFIRMGIAFAFEEGEESEAGNETRQARISCPEECRPMAYCEDPFFFRERVHFQILHFSPVGLTLSCSHGHAALLPQVAFELTVFLPMLGLATVEVRILRVSSSHKGALLAEAEYVGQSLPFRHAVAEYLLLSGAIASLESLREKMFEVGVLDRALRFHYATSDEDYAEIVRMRGGEQDRFDDFSRFLLCKVGERTVACSRVVFTDGDPMRSEFELLVKGIPQKLWVQRFIEVSRFHCEEGFSAKEVYLAFLRHFVRIAAESGSRFVLTACAMRAVRLYEKLGFRRLADATAGQGPGGDSLTVVCLDVHRVLTTKGLVDADVWTRVYADVSRHVAANEADGDGRRQVFWTRRSYG